MIESEPYPHDFHDGSIGVTFHLPARRRFIPNCWLLYAELNEQETELQAHYTHSLVTIEGRNLHHLLDRMSRFGVSWVREMPVTNTVSNLAVTRIEITEKTPE
jgi:hypothetical protein